jgi:ribosomal protein S18 acetylase RimI-like enzyme
MQLVGMLDSPSIRRVAAAIRDLGSRSERGRWPALRNPDALRSSSAVVNAAARVGGDRAVLTDVAPARCSHWHSSPDSLASLPPARVGCEEPAPVVGVILLRDGRRVTVAALTEGARDRFQQFVRDLSPTSRAMRFHASFHEAPESLLRELLRADRNPNVSWVAQEYGCDGPIVAEARFVVADGEGEIALAIADGWQRQGLGRALLLQLLRHAEVSGIRRIRAYVRRDNEPMLRLASSTGFDMHALPDDPSVTVAEHRLEATTSRARPAGRGQLLRSRDGAVPALARARAAQVIGWIRAFGLPTVAAIVLPGGFLVAAVAGLTHFRRRRTALPSASAKSFEAAN